MRDGPLSDETVFVGCVLVLFMVFTSSVLALGFVGAEWRHTTSLYDDETEVVFTNSGGPVGTDGVSVEVGGNGTVRDVSMPNGAIRGDGTVVVRVSPETEVVRLVKNGDVLVETKPHEIG